MAVIFLDTWFLISIQMPSKLKKKTLKNTVFLQDEQLSTKARIKNLGHDELPDNHQLVQYFVRRKLEETNRQDLTKKAALHIKRILGYVNEFHEDNEPIWNLLMDAEKCCTYLHILVKESGAEPGTVHAYCVTLNWLYEDVINGFNPKPEWPEKMEEVS